MHLVLECEEVISKSFEHLLQFLVVKMATSWLQECDSTTIGDGVTKKKGETFSSLYKSQLLNI